LSAIGISLYQAGYGAWNAGISLDGVVRYEYHLATSRREAWRLVRDWIERELSRAEALCSCGHLGTGPHAPAVCPADRRSP
jgi:hypothetical protein